MKKAIVSRTLNSTVAHVLSVDVESRTVKESTVILDGTMSVEECTRYFKKHDTTIVSVLSVENVSELLGMYESDFVQLATAFEERGKDTRDLITKTVTVKSSNCLVVNRDRQVIESVVDGTTEKDCRRACESLGLMFVKILNTVESTKLYGMDGVTFKLNAKKMVDRFTLEK